MNRVSHDACLVHALSKDTTNGLESMPLYVCKNSNVVLERGGFAKYKRDLSVAAKIREKRATAIAQNRAIRRAKDRREKLASFKKNNNNNRNANAPK